VKSGFKFAPAAAAGELGRYAQVALMARLFDLPPFLDGIVDRPVYVRWLRRKASAHLKRDRHRGNTVAVGAAYRLAIHAAVLRSNGVDEYTGGALRWELISQYDNDKAAVSRRHYKRQFYDLPTVDHVGDGLAAPDFKICSWQVNDAKHDQTYYEFVEMCRAVVAHSEQPTLV
jgi:hypothetical protein